MPPSTQPASLRSPARIREIACRTALGDARETVEALLADTVAVRPSPLYGEEGGDSVPLALRHPFAETVPPRWWEDLRSFIAPLAGQGWGGTRQPVFLTSSNFGIDGLYGLSRSRDAAFAKWSTPQACARQISLELGLGENVTLFSHACVSAQLGLYQAAEWLEQDLADRALVLSFDYVGPFVAAGFHSLKILNEGLPAPYRDQETGSIGLGDGLAWVVLEKRGDGPTIEAQMLYNEMFHFTANAPGAAGFQRALDPLREVLEDRSFWIKGHGTGTLEAGRMEAESTHALFPGHPLVSWKGSLGHTLGSCALVEMALALEAHAKGRIPGTVGTRGPCFSPDVATGSFAASPFDSILMLSNAFGGAHGAMIVSHA